MENMDEKLNEDILPGYSSLDDFLKNGFKVLVDATKASNSLPTERDWDFYKLHESFNKIINTEGDTVLRLMNRILHIQNSSVNIRNRDVEEKMEILIEANDDILEKAAGGIDMMNGIKKDAQEAVEIQAVSAQLPVNGSWNQLHKATYSVSSSIGKAIQEKNAYVKSVRLLAAKNIVRPQSFFKDKIDNRNVPWCPRITDKPNNIKPLAIFLEQTENGEMYTHPYEFELDYFTPAEGQLQAINPIQPKSIRETPLYEITTPEQLNGLLEELHKHSVFSVDLEHHSYRTFMGITCLLQISTKDADYLIDTLVLRDKLWVLNEVFTKPSIVKVFHGADCDVEWLQRDLSLYVVNMFDTHKAAKQLNYSGLSLAYLLNRYCNVIPNKHFQLADWRIRPLPDELKSYARMDTHYLIYIYHMLRNELLKVGNGSDNILKSVIQQSTQVCQKRYIKPILRDDSYLDFYRKCKRMFDNRQMYALKELYNWRDNIARTEDESTGYVPSIVSKGIDHNCQFSSLNCCGDQKLNSSVLKYIYASSHGFIKLYSYILPNHMLLQISEILPREMQGILACCNPIPPLVRANLLELHRIILRAREQPTVKPILKEENRSRGSAMQTVKINVDSPLNCPHDLSKTPEFRDDLPTLLNIVEKIHITSDLEKNRSVYSIFNTPDNSDDECEYDSLLKIKELTVLAPYERYKLVKPYIQAQEDKAAAESIVVTSNEVNKEESITNDDRIAALHAHFVKVAHEMPQIQPGAIELPEPSIPTTPETLVSMGGSKKRKRDDFQQQEVEFHPHYEIPSNELLTPIPKRNRRPQKNRNRQNNFHSPAFGGDPSSIELPAPVHKKKPNRRPVKNKKKLNHNATGDANQAPNWRASDNRFPNQSQPPQKNSNNKPARRKSSRLQKDQNIGNNQKQHSKQARYNFDPRQQVNYQGGPQMSQAPNINHQQNSRISNRQRKRRQWFKMKDNCNQTLQSTSGNQTVNNQFTPFDYSSVNFQQFQGGSGGANRKQNVKTQFKGKNKNKKFNKNSNNKSMTFDRNN